MIDNILSQEEADLIMGIANGVSPAKPLQSHSEPSSSSHSASKTNLLQSQDTKQYSANAYIPTGMGNAQSNNNNFGKAHVSRG
jgi:hypothetical protein